MSKSHAKTLVITGDHTEINPIEDGTRILLSGGDLVLEGPVGNNVYIQVDGNVTLNEDAGSSLYVFATGEVRCRNVGRDADISSAGGQARVVTLGENGWLRGRFGVAATSPKVKCSDHEVFYGDNYLGLYRKPNQKPDEAPRDPESCMKPQYVPNELKH